jgi:transposase-like protein
VKGRWTYLYRTVDFLLSEKRDVAAATRFFGKALKNNGAPQVITLDAYAASHRAVAEMKSAGTLPRRVGVRSSKYLNNMIEQYHRRIKYRIRPKLEFKRFGTEAVTISGIEMAEMIKRHQLKIGKLVGRTKTVPGIWAVVLAA